MSEKELIMMAAVLVSLFALAGGANQFIALFKNLSKTNGGAEERKVTMAASAATKQEFDQHVQENSRMFEQMRAEASKRGRDLFEKIEDTKSELGKEITCVRESVAGLEKQGEITNQLMARMDGKLDRLHERKH